MHEFKMKRYDVKEYKTFSNQVSIFEYENQLSIILFIHDKKLDSFYIRQFNNSNEATLYMEMQIEKDAR